MQSPDCACPLFASVPSGCKQPFPAQCRRHATRVEAEVPALAERAKPMHIRDSAASGRCDGNTRVRVSAIAEIWFAGWTHDSASTSELQDRRTPSRGFSLISLNSSNLNHQPEA